MTWASDSELETAIELYNRSVRLLNNIRRFPRDSMHRRDRSLARHYNDLRRDVVRFIADRHLTQLVPGPVWCLETWHVALGVAVLGALIGIAWLSSSSDAKIVSMIAVVALTVALLAGLLFIMPWERTDPWYWRASPLNTVAERTTASQVSWGLSRREVSRNYHRFCQQYGRQVVCRIGGDCLQFRKPLG